jgi:hypothetical protein
MGTMIDPVRFISSFAPGIVVPIPTLPLVSNETFGLSVSSPEEDVYARTFEAMVADRIGFMIHEFTVGLLRSAPVALMTIEFAA